MSTNNIKNNIPNIKNNYINQPLSNNNTILNKCYDDLTT